LGSVAGYRYVVSSSPVNLRLWRRLRPEKKKGIGEGLTSGRAQRPDGKKDEVILIAEPDVHNEVTSSMGERSNSKKKRRTNVSAPYNSGAASVKSDA